MISEDTMLGEQIRHKMINIVGSHLNMEVMQVDCTKVEQNHGDRRQ